MLPRNLRPMRLSRRGRVFLVAEQVTAWNLRGRLLLPAISITPGGLIAYRTGPQKTAERHQMAWFDRFGKEISKVGSSPGQEAFAAALSPNGRLIAFGAQIWLLDPERNF